jgi:hypothetical protein
VQPIPNSYSFNFATQQILSAQQFSIERTTNSKRHQSEWIEANGLGFTKHDGSVHIPANIQHDIIYLAFVVIFNFSFSISICSGLTEF